jgi:cell wall-associated NlpC family hydrolase
VRGVRVNDNGCVAGEVRMTGSYSARSLKVIAIATIASCCVASVAPLPADAHRLGRYRRERRHLEARAREQIGAPYRYGGTSPSGFDCSGFTRWVFAEHGASLPHSSSDQFYMGRRAGYRRIWKRNKLKPGDLVFHKTTSARVGHAGMYIGGGRFISATTSDGVRIRSIWDPSYWGPRFVGAVRVPVTQSD